MQRLILAGVCLFAIAATAEAQDHPKGAYTLFVVVAGNNGASIALSAADTFDNEADCIAAAKAVSAPAAGSGWSAGGICAPTGQSGQE